MSVALSRHGDLESPDQRALAGSRWPFLALCLFLASQVYTLPVMAVGPSWAVWPTPQDFTIAFLALTCLLSACRGRLVSQDHRQLLWILAIAFAACLVSFVLFIVFLPIPGLERPEAAVGLFLLFRLGQFLLVFWATAQIPLSPWRVRKLYQLMTVVLCLVCLGVVATFFNVLPPPSFVQHLPQDKTVMGPWYEYVEEGAGRGWGAVGYNHGYVSAQILMLLALVIRFKPSTNSVASVVAILLALVSGFLTGSRAGFASIALFTIITVMQRPAIGILVLACLLIGVSQITTESLPEEIQQIKRSQEELSDPLKRDSLNGRMEIWEERFGILRANPWILPLGGGFGYSGAIGDAHNVMLQVVMELGVVGLCFWFFLTTRVLTTLYRREPRPRAIFWLTIASLFSSLTQETFYPVPAMGGFLGLYLCSLALALPAAAPGKDPFATVQTACAEAGDAWEWDDQQQRAGLQPVLHAGEAS